MTILPLILHDVLIASWFHEKLVFSVKPFSVPSNSPIYANHLRPRKISISVTFKSIAPIMLCQTCKSLDFDKLIPVEADLEVGVISGTKHYENFADLVAAAKSGCELCVIIERSMTVMVKQVVLRERLMSEPIYLKMRLKGRAYTEYQGCSELLVYCLGKIIAHLEMYVSTGMISSAISKEYMTYSR
jgi:hypothetical protein